MLCRVDCRVIHSIVDIRSIETATNTLSKTPKFYRTYLRETIRNGPPSDGVSIRHILNTVAVPRAIK
jgi:hypothetical protein